MKRLTEFSTEELFKLVKLGFEQETDYTLSMKKKSGEGQSLIIDIEKRQDEFVVDWYTTKDTVEPPSNNEFVIDKGEENTFDSLDAAIQFVSKIKLEA